LDLATTVFICHEPSSGCHFSHRPYLFKRDDIAQHHRKLDSGSHSNDYSVQHHLEYEPEPPKIKISALESEIAAAIVRAVGLDDKIATVSNMDAKTNDIRFGCSFCLPIRNYGLEGSEWMMVGYKWRELVGSSL
jgi:hypothetical protein